MFEVKISFNCITDKPIIVSNLKIMIPVVPLFCFC